jgi:hypothetical protein
MAMPFEERAQGSGALTRRLRRYRSKHPAARLAKRY